MAQRNDHVSLWVDIAERTYSDKYLEKNRKMFPIMARFTNPKSYDRFFKKAYAILDFDVREKLGEIKNNTLIIAGDNDKTLGNEAAHELNEGISGSELFIYEGLAMVLTKRQKISITEYTSLCDNSSDTIFKQDSNNGQH